MKYSSVALSSRPIGYWQEPDISSSNLLSDSQSNFDTALSGWSGVNGSVSRTTAQAFSGTHSMSLAASSTSASSAKMSTASRILCGPGTQYTMVARVRSSSGNKSVSITSNFYTTTSGGTLSRSSETSQVFTVTDSDWTLVHLTSSTYFDALALVDYYAEWSIDQAAGSAGSTIYIDSVQFFPGLLYALNDRVGNNNADLDGYTHTSCKPIVFGGSPAIRLDKLSTLSIPNTYGLLIGGKEAVDVGIDFFFTINNYPNETANLASLGGIARVYLRGDRVILEAEGKTDSRVFSDWYAQHYAYLSYSNKTVSLVIDGVKPMSIELGDSFTLPAYTPGYAPGISIGPASPSYNLLADGSLDSLDGISSGSAISIITADSHSSSKCLQVVTSGSDWDGIVFSNRFFPDAYEEYTVSAYVKVTSGTANVYCGVDMYSTYDTYDGPNTHTSNQVISSADEWVRLTKTFTAKHNDLSAEVFVKHIDASGPVTMLVDSVVLERGRYASRWDEYTSDTDYLFVSDISLYTRRLTSLEISRRIRFITPRDINSRAREFSGDIFSFTLSDFLQTASLDAVLDFDNIVSYKNLYKRNDTSIASVIPPSPTFLSESNSLDVSLDVNGCSFSSDSMLSITGIEDYFSTSGGIITFTTDFLANATEGTYLSISPIVYGDYLSVKKTTTNKISVVLAVDGVESTLVESAALTSGEKSVALVSSIDGYSVYINGVAITAEASGLTSPTKIFVGNSSSGDSPMPDKIRCLSLRDSQDPLEIDYLSPGNYMLYLDGTIDVSIGVSMETRFVHATNEANSLVWVDQSLLGKLLVNGSPVMDVEPIITPDEEEFITEVSISADIKNSREPLLFSRLGITMYQLEDVESSKFGYVLHPLGDNPYIVAVTNYDPLSHCDNLGMKFVPGVTAGVEMYSDLYGSHEFAFEFLLRINREPYRNEVFDVCTTGGSGLIQYSTAGLVASGGITVYVDGQPYSGATQILVGEIYHIFVSINAATATPVTFGTDLDGSIGNVIVYGVKPSSISGYASDRHSDILAYRTLQISGGNMSVLDEEAGPQVSIFNTRRDYFRTEKLPKLVITSMSSD
jgi:hypothetical protein